MQETERPETPDEPSPGVPPEVPPLDDPNEGEGDTKKPAHLDLPGSGSSRHGRRRSSLPSTGSLPAGEEGPLPSDKGPSCFARHESWAGKGTEVKLHRRCPECGQPISRRGYRAALTAHEMHRRGRPVGIAEARGKGLPPRGHRPRSIASRGEPHRMEQGAVVEPVAALAPRALGRWLIRLKAYRNAGSGHDGRSTSLR